MNKHTENDVLKSLNKKHDVRVNPNTKEVILNRGLNKKNDLGNKSYGKIDFLKKIHKYKVFTTTKF